ncbi:MAG: hypothetical protein H6509_02825 [Bryobacterales bacterium]|nr:hypothetical protein [Bryobacterales bacterium]
MSEKTTQEDVDLQDLNAVCDELRREAAESSAGHAARTLLHEPDLRVVLIAMAPGGVIQEHKARSAGSIQTLRGAIDVQFPERSVRVAAGSLLSVKGGVRHSVTARDGGEFLLTLGRPE